MAASEGRYYPDLREFRSVGTRAGLGLTTTLPGRSSLFVNQTVGYSPSYYYGFSPRPGEIEVGDAATDNVDFATIDDVEAQYHYRTSIRFMRPVTQRTRIVARADYGMVDFVHENPRRLDTSSSLAEGGYAWTMTRATSATFGYRFQHSDVRNVLESTPTDHGIYVTVSHNRALSATRRALFTFRVGSTTTEAPFESPDGTLLLGRRYFLNAEMSATIPVSRSWLARANYTRSMEYIGTLDPIFADRARASIEGLLLRRITIIGSAYFSSGASSLDNLLFKTYTGSLETHVPLTSALGVYGNYRYHYYDYGGGLSDIPPDVRRNSVQLGLMLWLPMLGR